MAESRGALTEAAYYILLSLFEARHGYSIMQFVEQISAGRVTLGAGTLYGALSTLVERGLIYEVAAYDRKKEYLITDAGKAAVRTEMRRLAELLTNGRQIAGEP
ncbi:MAG: PadR family transcriptional regulator [Micrococcales bacterium]|nr:PadR family transcriptional regulator [Micrococcales bacterium]